MKTKKILDFFRNSAFSSLRSALALKQSTGSWIATSPTAPRDDDSTGFGRSLLSNFLGALSDGAILFPIIALLSNKAGFSGFTILWTTGLVYIFSAFFFRIPMAVQPLKSIAIAAISIGASFSEVRISGMLLGLYCLSLCIFDIDQIAKKVPDSILHELQAGLGALLIFQGIILIGNFSLPILTSVLFMLLFPIVKGIPVLGFIATIGLLIAVFEPQYTPSPILTHLEQETGPLRLGFIFSLFLPQIILTSTNSILGTQHVCKRYFGEQASRVTIKRLLCSIGFGNLWVGFVGGMPFCHGSGGITAHIKGGSTSFWSTATMGFILLILAGIQYFKGTYIINYPIILVSILLITTGMFHLKLSGPTFNSDWGLVKIASALFITIWTKNLIWTLCIGIALELMQAARNRYSPLSGFRVQR